MDIVPLVLQIVALVAFALAGVNRPNPFNLVGAGLFFWLFLELQQNSLRPYSERLYGHGPTTNPILRLLRER